MRTLALLLILAIILETVFYVYPFTLLVVIMTVLILGGNSLYWVFIAGIILDLAGLRIMGGNSIFFLLISAIMLRYNRRFNFNNVINVMIFITVTINVYSFIFYQRRADLFITLFLALLLLYLLPWYFPSLAGRKKLKV